MQKTISIFQHSNTELFLTFMKIGAFTFGGGYAMISLIEHECVEINNWLSASEMLDMVVIAESTPGPIAINCATYVGYKRGGIMGSICATFGVVLPSFILLFLISKFFLHFIQYKIVAKAFAGIRIGVAILIIQTAVKMLKTMSKSTPNKPLCFAIAIVFFAGMLTLNLLKINFSTIYLIIIAGCLGYAIYGHQDAMCDLGAKK